MYLRRKTSDIQAPNSISQFAPASHLVGENQDSVESVILGLTNINSNNNNNSSSNSNLANSNTSENMGNSNSLVDTDPESILSIQTLASDSTAFDLANSDMTPTSDDFDAAHLTPLIMSSSANTFLNTSTGSGTMNGRIYSPGMNPKSVADNNMGNKSFGPNTGR